MKKLFLLLMIAVLSLLLFVGCTNDETQQSVDLGEIKSSGRWMVDDSGRVLMIHGVNQVNKKPPYDHSSLGFDKTDAIFLQDYGFNAVRLGVIWAAIEPVRGEFDTAYLESIRKTIQLLKEHGIYSLLDFHQDAFSLKHGGSGFPSWAALGAGNSSYYPFPLKYFDKKNRAIAQDFDHFWNNQDGVQDSYMDMLSLVVKTLGEEEGVMGVEFINEPFPGTVWTECGDTNYDKLNYNSSTDAPWDFATGCMSFDSGHMTNFYTKAIQHVRALNENLMVVYDENTLGGIGAPPFIGVIADKNKVFSWHNYMYDDFESVFSHVIDYQETTSDSPLLMTEFGASLNIDKWSEVLSLSDTHLMSWMFWAYSNNPPYKIVANDTLTADGRLQGLVYDLSQAMDATNVAPERAVNLDLARVEALSRPYPQWTAGIPQSLAYDENTSLFSFKWSYQDFAGENKQTELFIPKHRYPNGYQVSVKNCRVVSGPPNKQKLVVENKIRTESFDAEVTIMPLDAI